MATRPWFGGSCPAATLNVAERALSEGGGHEAIRHLETGSNTRVGCHNMNGLPMLSSIDGQGPCITTVLPVEAVGPGYLPCASVASQSLRRRGAHGRVRTCDESKQDSNRVESQGHVTHPY